MSRTVYAFCGFIGFAVLVGTVSAEEVIECPDPLFTCIGPGSGGNPPGTPPDPIFRPIVPSFAGNVNFNRSYGIVNEQRMTITHGALELSKEMTGYLQRNRSDINPNSIYVLSPKSFAGPRIEGESIIIGGGALAQ